MQAIVMQQLGISTQVPRLPRTTHQTPHTHTHTHTGCRRVEGAGAVKVICFLGFGRYYVQLHVLVRSLHVRSVIHQACVRACGRPRRRRRGLRACVRKCLPACVRACVRARAGRDRGTHNDLTDACAMAADTRGGQEPDPRCPRPLLQGPLEEATPVPHSAPACMRACFLSFLLLPGTVMTCVQTH